MISPPGTSMLPQMAVRMSLAWMALLIRDWRSGGQSRFISMSGSAEMQAFELLRFSAFNCFSGSPVTT